MRPIPRPKFLFTCLVLPAVIGAAILAVPAVYAQRGGGGGAPDQPAMRMTNAEEKTVYVNVSRVTNTAEEFVIDLAFLDEPALTATRPSELRSRVLMSPYAAKRLMMRLEASVSRHEDTFGEIELDIRQRAANKPK